ncbi:MAG: hypothetical protein JW812_01020 [Alphaproteobacteria bacterium]|nr:hypothetical protein [Alphaproteobacteria bacterium]
MTENTGELSAGQLDAYAEELARFNTIEDLDIFACKAVLRLKKDLPVSQIVILAHGRIQEIDSKIKELPRLTGCLKFLEQQKQKKR